MRIIRTGYVLVVLTPFVAALTACSLLGAPQTLEPDSKSAEPTSSTQKGINGDRPLHAAEDPEVCDRYTNTVGFDRDMLSGATTGYVDCLTEGTEIVPIFYIARSETSGTYYKLVTQPLDLDPEGRFSFSYTIPQSGAAPGTAASLRFVAASGPDLDWLLQAPATFDSLPANAENANGIKLLI